jgi:hypothetical protein
MYNQENIEKLEQFYKEIEELKTPMDSEYQNIYQGSEERKHKLPNRDAETPEDALWYEVSKLGAGSEAGLFLKELYPKIFELADAYNLKVKEMETFAQKELRTDPLKITLLDIVRIAKSIVDNR